jgi:hypothetical protein
MISVAGIIRGINGPISKIIFLNILQTATRDGCERRSTITAAVEYARRIINDLREERRPEEPEPSIAVKNAAGEVIYRFPSN